jgi:hypothetical protein
MAKVDPIPDDNELEKRRKRKYIIDPKDVEQSENHRVKKWAREIMSKNEHKLNMKNFKNREIVTSGEVNPESIDMRLIYPFIDLNWIIFRNGQLWSLMLRSKEKMLCQIDYASI